MCDGKVKAVAEYKANHSDWEPSPKDCYIEVMDEKEKELIEGFFRKRGQGEIN